MIAAIPFPPLSPELFSFSLFGMEFALRWYALAYIVGVLIGWRIVVAALKRPAMWADDTPFEPNKAEDLMTWIILGVIIGGRLGYVFFYKPAEFLADPAAIIRVWDGGMAFHGGFLGVVLAVWLWARREGARLSAVADLLALSVPTGLLLGRLANFVNAELWGRATDVPWAVIFPGAHAQNCGQPVGELCARHPSQLYEAGLEGLLLGTLLLLMAFAWGRLKRPWLLTGTFFTGYGAARFFVESFRQPDAHFVTIDNPLGLYIHIDGWGLTAGQCLSLPMILVGLWLLTRTWGKARHA